MVVAIVVVVMVVMVAMMALVVAARWTILGTTTFVVAYVIAVEIALCGLFEVRLAQHRQSKFSATRCYASPFRRSLRRQA